VAALAAGGHDIRLLVRSPDRITPALQPLGLGKPVDHVVGDVTDRDSVERALDGCDAVVHAAAVYSLDSRAYRQIAQTNLRGTETVLDAAVRHGCDPVVHVSSFVALLQPRATVTADSPLSTARGVYVQSKAASEAVARRLQDDGAPVVIVHPGGVLGPHDPHLGDQVQRLRNILRGRYPTWPSGGYHQVDVRDVAKVHAAVMSAGAGPRSYIVPGHHVDGRTMFHTLQTVTGRRLRHVIVPARAMLPFTWLASAAQRVVPVHLPAEYEGVLLLMYDTRYDDSPARQQLGIRPRPLVDLYRDTVQWLHHAGWLTARQAGTTQ
jgi:nucleoside-diphosphate-sugar epimerase